MSFLLEAVLQIFMEFAAYGMGRVFVMIFLPWYGVEPLSSSRHDPREERRWKWRGVSYVHGGRRVLRIEWVQLIGLVIIIGLVVMGVALAR